jgi:DNA-binding transcriptional regulator GbsR (MarR family)
MDIWGEIGGAAGKVFTALEAESKPMTIAAIKKKTKLSDGMLNLALGWLAREDKVVLDKKQSSLKVKIK